MKKMFVLFGIAGFVLMLGAAGSADNNTISFFQALAMEISGIAVLLLSASGHCYYKKYCRNKRKRAIVRNKKVSVENTKVLNQMVKV